MFPEGHDAAEKPDETPASGSQEEEDDVQIDGSNIDKLDLSPEATDELLASTLNKLSIKEREESMYELHGVAEAVPEDPEFVSKKMEDMEAALHNIVSKEAYVMAEFQSPQYVHDHKFRLQFLRSESFDPKKAAKRMVVFFQKKLELFGPDRLMKDIKLSDMDAKDMKALESGCFQLLPARDRAGRAICVVIPPLFQYKSLDSLEKVAYYMMMSAAQDEETQKRGCLIIGYNMGEKRKVDPKAAASITNMRSVVPLKIVSTHYCYDHVMMRPMMSVATLLMGSYARARFRHHYGSHQENQYQLQTFGILTDFLPVTSEGEYKIKAHRKWVQLRREEERNANRVTRIVLPSQGDVLFGRGKPIQEHPGNIRYHYVLDLYQAKYEEAKKFEKMEVSELVLDVIAKQNGRFLKQDGAGWIEVTHEMAREKISHAFRTRRGGNNPGSVGNNTDSSDSESTTNRRPREISASPIWSNSDISRAETPPIAERPAYIDEEPVSGKRARVEDGEDVVGV